MTPLQYGFIALTFLGPVALWQLSRAVESPRLQRGISWSIASLLVAAYAATLAWLHHHSLLDVQQAFPVQLCDWASVAVIIALVTRRQTAFELAYFWGIAGTMQALFTPAIETLPNLRTWCFFTIHSLIPLGVFWLMFEFNMRPKRGALLRIIVWSEFYVAAALAVNWLTGGNYGFLSERPAQKTLLDAFPDPHWLYVACINATGIAAFVLMYLPWMRKSDRRDRSV